MSEPSREQRGHLARPGPNFQPTEWEGNGCCFKPPCFGVICHTAQANWYTNHPRKRYLKNKLQNTTQMTMGLRRISDWLVRVKDWLLRLEQGFLKMGWATPRTGITSRIAFHLRTWSSLEGARSYNFPKGLPYATTVFLLRGKVQNL